MENVENEDENEDEDESEDERYANRANGSWVGRMAGGEMVEGAR